MVPIVFSILFGSLVTYAANGVFPIDDNGNPFPLAPSNGANPNIENPGGGNPDITNGRCDPKTQICNPLKAKKLHCLVADVLNLVSSIGAIVVALFIIYSGYLFVTARGNPSKIEEAKRAIGYTLLGAAIVLGATVIANGISGTLSQILAENRNLPTISTTACN